MRRPRSRCLLPSCRLGGGVVKWTAPAKYKGQTRCSYTSRITAINGNVRRRSCRCLLRTRPCSRVWGCSLCRRAPAAACLPSCAQMIQLERYLPYDINAKMVSVTVTTMPDTVHESGVEGLTFKFDWSLYPGHHCVSMPAGSPWCRWGAVAQRGGRGARWPALWQARRGEPTRCRRWCRRRL